MNARAVQAPTPPVTVIESLTTGFETVTSHLVLILLPLGLDLLLWLGPHLSVRPVVQDLLNRLTRLVRLEPSVAQVEAAWRTLLTPLAQRYNLLSLLSVPALPRVGCLPGAWCLPSLMAGRSPIAVPGGQPAVIDVAGWLELLTLVIALYLVGLLLGAWYLGPIAMQVRDARINWGLVGRRVWGWWARLAALAALVGLAIVVFMTPVTLAAVMAGQAFGEIGVAVVYFGGASVGVWGLFYLGFVVHALLLLGRGLLGAIRDSVRVVQWNLPGTFGLFALTIGLSLGLGVIWRIPAEDSWLSLIGIAGHAYVVTGLAAGTFVFYKDRYRWSAEFREYLAARAEAERKKKKLTS